MTGQNFDAPGGIWYNTGAKVFCPIRADFLFQGSSYIIVQRPPVVTMGKTFASFPPSDTGGRNILNGPNGSIKQKSPVSQTALFRATGLPSPAVKVLHLFWSEVKFNSRSERMNGDTQTTFIYGLTDPDTSEVRYIGKADNPTYRYKRHLGLYEKKPTHKTNWIKSLLAKDQKPGLLIIEEVDKAAWEEAERRWIGHYTNLGCRLVNMAPGGLGGDGGPITEEEREHRRVRGRDRVNAIWNEIRKDRENYNIGEVE